ncbi:hypothetical protein [Streptomyces scabiei]|uniref:hypothetical protein n=1 Tax=Streptomyces scabiei TaxID=1930 RepID=UPI0029B128DE|nr:hypothetical protein [Streptomyces scabiei]MDX2802725.1 hypothetical protein [Streptomyces scabiei]
MTARRTLGTGPQGATSIRAAQADMLPGLPNVPMPDLEEMRARGVLGRPPAVPAARRRALGDGARDQNSPTASGSSASTSSG